MSVNDSSEDSVIWTDGDTSRELIWSAYIGFKENYEKYMMYLKSYGYTHDAYKGGLYRYAVSLYEEIRPFKYKLKKIDNWDTVERILDKSELFDKKDNVTLVMRFFNDFLYMSGMKNIIFQKDTRSGIDKIEDMYRIRK